MRYNREVKTVNAFRSTFGYRLPALLLALALVGPMAAQGDDRELVKGGNRDPYLHVIFDVSGSMNWQPPDADGTPPVPGDAWAPGYGDDPNSKMYQAKSALYTVVSDPTLRNVIWGFSTYNQDDLQVHRKHWIYTPQTVPAWVTDGRLPYPMPGQPKHFGDPCMDDERSNLTCDLDDGQAEVFGQLTSPTLGSCGNPQDFDGDTTLDEDEGEVYSFPVLGNDATLQTDEWLRFSGRRFRLRWVPISGGFGAEEIGVQLQLREARSDCSDWVGPSESASITFERVYATDRAGRNLPGANEVLFWQQDNWTDQNGGQAGFFQSPGSSQIRDMQARNTCAGWEPNNDSFSDIEKGVRLKYLTQDDPLGRHSSVLDRGDVIPLDWRGTEAWGVSNRDAILQRLSPNFDPDDPGFMPDFRSAPYFQDTPDSLLNNSSQGRLELKPEFVDTPPLIPQGATPIGNSMKDFLDWYDDWKPEACDPDDGDAYFGCRSVNLLILTDGNETCYNHGDGPGGPLQDGQGNYNPCRVATQLLTGAERDIRTFVIGFGVQGANANFLNCIAENGGTDFIDLDQPPDGEPEITGPILPGSEQELVDALRQIVSVITVGARSFSSAAVPQGQVNVQDKVYLTSFLPDRELVIWPARIDSYLKPIPLVEVDIELPDGTLEPRNVPNPSRKCNDLLESACHLWNGGEQLLAQAAEDAELVPGDYNLGTLEDERRVYYGADAGPGLPRERRFFAPPTSPSTEDDEWQYLLESMGICAPGNTSCGLDADKRDEGTGVMDFLHRRKFGNVPKDDPRLEPEPAEYILGDVFHSDPVVLGGPDDFRYWVADVGGPGDDDPPPPGFQPPLDNYCDTSPGGYRCFFAKQRNRRKLLLAGANDGQVHAFDAGIFRGKLAPGNPTTGCITNSGTGEEFVVGRFDNGTGNELFSYVPTAVMPTLNDLKDSLQQEFTVDGRISSGDVLIDPMHGGTPSDREWRTVIMGGLREGGSGYYMLDVTHPDTLTACDDTPTIPTPLGGDNGYVPSCVDACTGGVAGSDYPYPMPLWEFYDNEDCGTYLPDGRCDDDVNNRADLADSWSGATIGRIEVLVDEGNGEGPKPEDRYVAVFGGGLDPERKGQEVAGGNFLFMVDIETGKAIYKRELIDPDTDDDRGVGSAPSDPAAVDTDQDGYLDTIYIGTTGGYMFKADISEPRELVDLGSLGLKVTDLDWAPFPVFDTGDRPIYHPPAVVFVAQRGQFAMAFGTGDREDLWSLDSQEGRLYMILDNNFVRADFDNGTLPKDEGDYAPLGRIDAEGIAADRDLLRGAPFGWFITLDSRERVITRTFALGGVTIFSSFQPREEISEEGNICLRRGSSRVFVVNTTNANALLESTKRYFVVEGGFLSAPFVETGATTNPEEECTGEDCAGTDAVVPANLDEIMDELRALLPPQCRFANYTINIKAVRDDTGIEFLAAIPVCTVRTNWREF